MYKSINNRFGYLIFPLACFLVLFFMSFNNKVKQDTVSDLRLDTLQLSDQIALDTLFSMKYFYPFDLQIYSDTFCLGIMGSDNAFYYYKHDSLVKQFKIDNKYFIETIELSSDYLLFGNGAENQNEYLFVYNKEFEYLYNRTTLQVNELNVNGVALCWADYSNDQNLSLTEQMVSYHYLFDVKSRIQTHKFRDNHLVVSGYDGFFEFDIKSYSREGGQSEVTRYDEFGIKKDVFSFYLPKRVVPIYFFSDKYISEKSGKIIVYDFQGNLLNTFEIAPYYYHKFLIRGSELHVLGWLDTDKAQDEYHFVKQVFSLVD